MLGGYFFLTHPVYNKLMMLISLNVMALLDKYQLLSWVIINGDGECSFLAAYRRAYCSSPSAWFKVRQPFGAVLHSSREPGELSQWLWVMTLAP